MTAEDLNTRLSLKEWIQSPQFDWVDRSYDWAKGNKVNTALLAGTVESLLSLLVKAYYKNEIA